MRFSEISTGYKFLEGGQVDSDGAIFFSDYALGGVYRLDAAGVTRRWLEDVRGIGGTVLNGDGGLVVSGMDGIWLLDLDTGKRAPILLEVEGQRRGFNDIEGDGHGGFYAGTIDLAARAQQRPPSYGELLHVTPDGRCTILARDIGAANGIGIDADRGMLYLSDTGTGIWRFPLPAPGMVGERALLYPMADSDGLAVDAGGIVWVAAWETGAVVRIDPATREATRYPLPDGQAMTLAFGGPDWRDLYVFGGADVLNPHTPATASIYRARTDHAGRQAAKAAIRPTRDRSEAQPAMH